MKKLTALLCAAAMTVSMAMTAMAAPSIGELIPEAPAVKAGAEYIPEGYTVAVKNAQVDNYKNETVKEAVKAFNAENSTVTIQDTMKTLGVDVTAENKTTDGTVVDLTEYKALMPEFADLVLEKGAEVSYTIDGKIEVSVKLELAKELTKEDLLIMQVDPETGEVYFIEVKDFDPATGEITAEFPCLGPFTVLTKGATK